MTNSKSQRRVEVTGVLNGNVYCAKCGGFLGMTCDPFRDSYHENCFPKPNKKKK